MGMNEKRMRAKKQPSCIFFSIPQKHLGKASRCVSIPLMNPPPIPSEDTDHLRVLAICHYVEAGLKLLMCGFIPLHYTIMKMMLKDGGMVQMHQKMVEQMAAKNGQAINPMPFDMAEMFELFEWLYVIGAVFMMIALVLNVIAGRFIQRRVNRLFCLITAGFNCLSFPLGTALGVFTFIVLTRDSVRRLFAETART